MGGKMQNVSALLLAVLSFALSCCGANPPLTAMGAMCGGAGTRVAVALEENGLAAVFGAAADHAGGKQPPVVLGRFNVTDWVIGLVVAATAADVDGDGVDELVLASATGTGKWDADAVQALALAPDCRSVKVKASSGTVGKGRWEALVPLRSRAAAAAGAAAAPVTVLAIQANAPNASFVNFSFSPPFYMDDDAESDLGIGAGATSADRLAWAALTFGFDLQA